jgi:hypothetical protein
VICIGSMKTLVVPDIHNKVNIVEKILSKESNANEVIFLGDWFDDFNDTTNDACNVCDFIKSINDDTKMIFLWGNHDMYYHPNRSFHVVGKGHSHEKQMMINRIMNNDDWSKFKFYHFSQNFLFSHAGITSKNSWLFNKSSFDLNLFDQIINQADEAFKNKENHFMFRAGYSRGGMLPVGGITWCDFHKDFEPYNNLNQIFGHTIVEKPSYVYAENSINLCLDTNLQHYAIINDSELEIYSVS